MNSRMIELRDGKHAVCLDEGPFHGWVFFKHPDGQWVSLRKALPEEIADAKRAEAIAQFIQDCATYEEISE